MVWVQIGGIQHAYSPDEHQQQTFGDRQWLLKLGSAQHHCQL